MCILDDEIHTDNLVSCTMLRPVSHSKGISASCLPGLVMLLFFSVVQSTPGATSQTSFVYTRTARSCAYW